MKKALLFLLLASFNLSAQVLLNTFKPLIPQVCIDSDKKRESVNSRLEYLADINPSFIYNYLVYLKTLPDDPLGAKATEQHLNYEVNLFNEKYAEWLERESSLINSDGFKAGQWYRLNSYFDFDTASADSGIAVANYVIDNNYRNYVTYLAHKRLYEDYNKETDYYTLLNETINLLIKNFSELYNSERGTYSNEYIETLVNTAIANPFLFKDTFLPYLAKPAPVNFTDFYLKATSLMTNTLSFSVGPGLDFSTNYGEPVYSEVEMTVKFKPNFRIKNSYQANMDWNINTRGWNIYLSNIKLGLSVGYTNWYNSSFTAESEKAYRVIVFNGGGTRVDPNFTFRSLHYSSLDYQLRLTTQFLYFSKLFNIEAGALFSYNNFSYKADMKRWDNFYRSGLNENLLVRFDRETELKTDYKKFNIYPLIFVNYNVWNPLTLRLSVFSFTQIPQLHLLYNIDFVK